MGVCVFLMTFHDLGDLINRMDFFIMLWVVLLLNSKSVFELVL